MDIFSGVIAVLVVLVTSVYLYSKWKHSYWTRRNVRQLQPQFFYGDTKEMLVGDKSMGETFLGIYRKFKGMGVKYGGIYILYQNGFFPIDPQLIKDVMHKSFDHFNAHTVEKGSPNSALGQNLFSVHGEQWRTTRRKLTPTFTSGKMKMMYETLWEKTKGLSELVDEYAQSGKPANVKLILGRFTMDVIGSVGFGLECNALKDPNTEFIKYGSLIFDSPKKKPTIFELITRVGDRRKRDTGPLEKFFKDLVSGTIEYREANKIYRKDFMHLMIQLKNLGVVTDDGEIFDKTGKSADTPAYDIGWIAAQCLLFFAAGYETSATTMTFALLHLAQNQDVQDKVRQEVRSIFNKYGGKITYDAMLELAYAEKVIQETLRITPSIAAVPRTCTKNYTIPGTDVVIEKGTMTYIPVWGLHTDPDYFPNPDKFDPERFSEENKKNIKEFTYLPFGEGPRMCLGLRFGMMQSKIGLVSLVKDFKFTLHPNTRFPLKMQSDGLVLRVEEGVWLNVEKVE